jgi:putative salt-induced outer membrane protein YdiY
VVALAAALLLAGPALAQDTTCPCPPPSPPPPAWTGSLGGGLSLTSGNSETNSYNLDFALTHDPRTKSVFKADGSYLRTDTDGESTVDRTGLGVRWEFAPGSGRRAFAFGEVRYLRDLFKDVEYLVTPAVGLGYRLADRDDLKFSVDAGLGAAFEHLTGFEATTSGTVNAGETLSWKFSKSASFVHGARGLWKVKDFGDAYYHLDVGIVASLTSRFDLKLSFADDYKTKPPVDKKKSDTAVLATIKM